MVLRKVMKRKGIMELIDSELASSGIEEAKILKEKLKDIEI